jgi:hypothetical protein
MAQSGDAFYDMVEEPTTIGPAATCRVRSSEWTTGPWAPGLQHAGPPSALLTRAVRRLAGLPERALPARLSFEILTPVPVAELVVTARVVRPGRRITLAEANLASAAAPEQPAMLLRAWLLRQVGDGEPIPGLPPTPSTAPPGRPEQSDPMSRPAGWHPGYLDAIEWRWVEGSFERTGPAAVWTRLGVDLVAGETPDGIERLVAVADSASGISAVASPAELLFVNTDLTLHLTREPVGPDIWLRAETLMSPLGVGRTVGELGDARGAVAGSAQCLFVAPRD